MTFRRAPLAAAAVCFAGGIALARVEAARFVFVPSPLLLGALVMLAMLACVALLFRLRMASAPVAAVWVVLGLAAPGWRAGPVAPVRLMSFADNLSRTVRGRVVRVREIPVVSDAADADAVPAWEAVEEVRESGERRLSVDLAVDRVEEVTPDAAEMVAASGGLRLSVYGAAGFQPRCGDQFQMPLRMKLPGRYRDPGAFQYADYLLGQGIAVQASTGAGQVQVVGGAEKTWPCRVSAA